MQNENSESTISNNDNYNTMLNATDTAETSNITINANSTADTINTANIIANTNNAFSKKIGRTTYTVHVYFSTTSKESFNDKLLRLIKNEIVNGIKGA